MPSCSHFHTSRLCWPLPGAEPSLHMQSSHCAAIKLCIVDRFPLAVLGSMSSGLTRKCAVPCLSCGNGASSKSIRELRPCTTYSDSSEDVTSSCVITSRILKYQEAGPGPAFPAKRAVVLNI